MRVVDRSRYGEPARRLIETALASGLPATLVFGRTDEAARVALSSLGPRDVGGSRPVRAEDSATGLRAGLWLLHELLKGARSNEG
jgi:hypothetical protein